MNDRDDLPARTDEEIADETAHNATHEGEHHATTGGAAAAGAITGAVVGLTAGPVGAVVGAVGGAILGAAGERVMHHDDDAERAAVGLDNDHDGNPLIEDRDRAVPRDTEMPTTATGMRTDTDRMELREEEVRPRITSEQTGEVRLGKDVVSEERTLDVPVSREEVVIDRHAVDRRLSDAPIGDGERSSLEVPVREERVSIEKEPVVYEEVGIGKRQVTETQNVDTTVRREELRVDREGSADRPSS